MDDNSEQNEKASLMPDTGDFPALKGLEILKFGQLERLNLDKTSGEELPLNRTTDFTDSKNRPITIKEWNTEKFSYIRAYNTNCGDVPQSINPGQAGLANLAIETDYNNEKKMRLGDIIIPESYRGSGIAKKMLDQSIAVAKERGATQIYGVIENKDARNFWNRMQEYGWKIDPDKGSDGYAYFDIAKDNESRNEDRKENVPAFQPREKFVPAASLNQLDIPSFKLDDAPLPSTLEQKPEDQVSAPFLSDRMKKVLVGVSILATLTSSGVAFEEYQKTHPPDPETKNEIVIEQPQKESAFGALIENKAAEYHLTETPVQDASTAAVIEKVATPSAELIEKQPAKDVQDLNTKPDNATYWYDVPEYKQPDGRSCTPTSVSMVMGYWNQLDSKNQARSTKDLYKENVDEGKFTSTGMVITDLDDEIQEAKYESKTTVDGTRSDLEEALAKGPVIALVKYSGKELAPRGVNHAVVVSGMTEDDQVRVTDPMHGTSRLYTWKQFDAAWGASWGTNATRYFTSIQPSDRAGE